MSIDRPVKGIADFKLRSQAGFAVLEVLVSALLLAITCLGAFAAIDAATRSTADERQRAEAAGLAQQDQARLRSMRISDLANLHQTRTVTQDGTPFTVTSDGDFVTDSTGTAACTPGTASADYVRITSTATWPSLGGRPPVTSESIVSPNSGSVAADRGALAIQVEDAQNSGLPGVQLSGTGAGSFNGTTGSSGCVIFGDLPEGNYTLTPSGTNLVDRDGHAPAAQPTSVIGQSTNTLALQYDHPGSIAVGFNTRVGGDLVPSKADSVMVFNTGMSAPQSFGTIGQAASTVNASGLFPFTSPDTVYAGNCTGDNPNPSNESDPPSAAALASVSVPSGGSVPATVQLPALKLTVWSGTGPASQGTAVPGANVTVSDQNCTNSDGTLVERTYTTDANGQLPDPGLPYSVPQLDALGSPKGGYNVCADDVATHAEVDGVSVPQDPNDLDAGTSLDLYLGVGSGLPGPCT